MYQRWFEAFHAVATAGGFTAAARQLNLGQPTVSTHVKTLEDHFGVELFRRRGRKVELTPAGLSLLTITRGLYGHEREAIEFLRAARALSTGELKVGAIGPYDVMELLEAFSARHPGMRLSVSLGSTAEVLERLERFDIDLGILGRAPTEPRFHSLFYRRHRVLVMVNAGHRLAARRAIRLAELAGEEMVLRAEGSTTRAAFAAALERAGVAIRPVMEINSREAVREAIIRGLGIGVVSAAEFAPHERLRTLAVSDAEIHTEAHVVCLAERRERTLIGAFLAIAETLAADHRAAAPGLKNK